MPSSEGPAPGIDDTSALQVGLESPCGLVEFRLNGYTSVR